MMNVGVMRDEIRDEEVLILGQSIEMSACNKLRMFIGKLSKTQKLSFQSEFFS